MAPSNLAVALALCCSWLPLCAGTSLALNTSTPLVLKVYWEALCPTSQFWMLEKYQPVWRKPEFRNIVKVETYAYGNAQTGPTGAISCQHGEKECLANKMITCAQHKLSVDDATNFMFCAVSSLKGGGQVNNAVTACAPNQAMSDQIIGCYTGNEGASLFASIASVTKTITHRYVPWVTDASGNQLKGAEDDLHKYLCSVVPVSQRPQECSVSVLMRSEASRSQAAAGDDTAEGCMNPYYVDGDKFAGLVEHSAEVAANATAEGPAQTVAAKLADVSPHGAELP